jgi:hypothetical protein
MFSKKNFLKFHFYHPGPSIIAIVNKLDRKALSKLKSIVELREIVKYMWSYVPK